MLNLYVISQTENHGYDTYDSAVVCAESEELAKLIHPCYWGEGDWSGYGEQFMGSGTWCDACYVSVDYLGEARPELEAGVICASFNAG